MKVLLLLAVLLFAFPAFAGSITFYGSQASGPYVGGGAVSNEGTFRFNVTGWTGASINNIVDYPEGSMSASWKGTTLSGVHNQPLNLISGSNSKGYVYTNGGASRRNGRTPVPEPETLGLLGTGLFAIGGLVRRKLKVDNLPASSDVNRPEGSLRAQERNFWRRTAPRWRMSGNKRDQSMMTPFVSPLDQFSTVASGVSVFTSPASDSAIATEVEAL